MATIDEKVTQFREASAELADELEPTAADAAGMLAEYHALKHPAFYVTADGDRMSAKDYNARMDFLGASLKRWIIAHGDEDRDARILEVEGFPALRVSYPSTSSCVPALRLRSDSPEVFEEAMKANCVEVSPKAVRDAGKRGLVTFDPESIIVKGKGTPRLAFDRED